MHGKLQGLRTGVEGSLREFRTEVDGNLRELGGVKGEVGLVHKRLGAIEGSLDSWKRTTVVTSGSMTVGVLGVVLTIALRTTP